MYSQGLSVLLAKLLALSPMPSNEELEALSEEGSLRLERYVELIQEIRQETEAAFPVEVVSIRLSSFGVGDGFEAYWPTLHLIESFPDQHSLYSLIQKASKSPNPGTSKWCCLPYLLTRGVRIVALLHCGKNRSLRRINSEN